MMQAVGLVLATMLDLCQQGLKHFLSPRATLLFSFFFNVFFFVCFLLKIYSRPSDYFYCHFFIFTGNITFYCRG